MKDYARSQSDAEMNHSLAMHLLPSGSKSDVLSIHLEATKWDLMNATVYVLGYS